MLSLLAPFQPLIVHQNKLEIFKNKSIFNFFQGNYVLATYGVIIVWAIILGAIVWSVSVGRFSGLLSGRI